MLTAETKHGRPRHIRVVNIAGNQTAEVVRIFARSAASALVKQKPNAIDVLKKPIARDWSSLRRERLGLDAFCLPLTIELR